MRRFQIAVALATASVMLGFATLGAAQERGKKRAPSSGRVASDAPKEYTKGPALPPPPEQANRGAVALNDPVPTFEVTVDPNLDLDAPTQALYDGLAAELDGFAPIPVHRTNFYSALIASPDYTLSGKWTGVIFEVDPVAGGHEVTLQVGPDFTAADGDGVAATAGANYFEKYLVGNGTITYIDSFDPDGLAGEMPWIFVY